MFEKRRVKILNLLEKEPILAVKVISDSLQVSEMTIRRDLERLVQEGIVRRSFGEVSLTNGLNLEQAVKIRAVSMTTAKKNMARLAAGLVPDGSAVFLDAGTTICELSRILAKKSVIIATASIKTATMAKKKEARVFLAGGELDREEYYNLDGPTAEGFFRNMNANYAFVSAGGVSLEHGVTEYTEGNAHLKRTMLEQAETKILLADCSKFDRSKTFHACSLAMFDVVITDEEPAEAYREEFARLNIRVVIADSEQTQ